MEAKECSFNFISGQIRLEIPFFQRKYIWDESNWEELLKNLLDEKQIHFLGSIILKMESANAGEATVWSVIDGQQRLTTLSILLKACYDSYPENKRSNFTSLIDAVLLYKNKVLDTEKKIKLNLSYHDMVEYRKIVEEAKADENWLSKIILESETSRGQKASHKILQCYKYFCLSLKNKIPAVEQIVNVLQSETYKTLVKIELKNDENEQAIFDTINSAGVRLTSADIIKNTIYQRLRILLGSDNTQKAIELYRKTWEKVFENDNETIDYWNQISTIGRIKRDNQESLLHCVALIKGFYNPTEDTLLDLPRKYKEYIKNMDLESLKDFIEILCRYATMYKKIFIIQDNTTLYDYKNDLQRIVHIFRTLDVSTFNAYILFLVFEDGMDEGAISETTKKLLKELETYVVRCSIAGMSTKNYNIECLDFINGKRSPLDITKANNSLHDNNIESCLERIPSNKVGNVILFWIELARRTNNQKFDINSLKFEYTLEHVMPQTWKEYWPTNNPCVVDQDGNVVVDEGDAEKIRQSAIYELGNMTLLKTNLNSSLRNKSFKDKIEGEGRKKGIRAYSMLDVSKEIVEIYDRGEIWSEKVIRSRTKDFTVEVISIWPIIV